MDNIKTLLGAAYHEGITVEEINTFLQGKKLVDLKEGNYVAKDKYESAKLELDEIKKSTTDFESIKEEYTKLKEEKADQQIKDKLLANGINEKALKYVKGDLSDGTLADSDDPKVFKKNVEEYLKLNPQFAVVQPTPTPIEPTKKQIVFGKIDNKGEKVEEPQVTTNQSINDQIRLASGLKISVDGDSNV